MAAKLPNDLLSEIDAHPGEAIRVVDPTGKRSFYILTEERLTTLEAAAQQQSEATTQRLRALIAEGDRSPDVDGDVVHSELLARAKQIESAAS